MAKFELVATCLFGLEKLLGSSIEKIEPSTIDELTTKISEAEEVVIINENNYLNK